MKNSISPLLQCLIPPVHILLAVQTGMWILYEIEHGRMRLTGPSKRLAKPDAKMKPLSDYLETQGRFRLATGAVSDELEGITATLVQGMDQVAIYVNEDDFVAGFGE